jgi:hypothetical protein
MARYLSVVERPYRATIEEQDDTAVWFTHAIANAGASVSLLLRGDAANYVLKGQDASGLRFGTREVRVPPRLDEDIEALLAKKVPVYFVREDAQERGLPESGLLSGLRPVSRGELSRLFADHDRVIDW